MNQQIKKLALLVCIICMAQAITVGSKKDPFNNQYSTVTHISQHKYLFPRTSQSCSNNDIVQNDGSINYTDIAITYGWYWDGQYCQPCDHVYCQCSKQTSTCDSCIEGYKKLVISEGNQDWLTCMRCPTLNNVGGSVNTASPSYFYKTHLHNSYSLRDQLENPDVKECEIYNNLSKSNNDWLGSREGKYSVNPNYHRWQRALRSTQCGDNRPQSGILYQHYGSICWYILGCSEYNKFGRCNTCFDGWYLNDKNECDTCRQDYSSSTYNNYVYGQQGNEGTTGVRVKSCSKCSRPHQCDQCAEGFYLVSPMQYQNTDKNEENFSSKDISRKDRVGAGSVRSLTFNVLDEGSWCAPCPSGCSCSSPVYENGQTSFVLVAREGYYRVEDRCETCSSVLEYCYECNSSESCTECQDFIMQTNGGVNEPVYLLLNTNTGRCQTCPFGCHECEFNTTAQATSCKERRCFNGYREIVEKDTGRRYCERCKSPNARCFTNNEDEEEPTQCITNSTNGGNYDTTIFTYSTKTTTTLDSSYNAVSRPQMNFSPPNKLEYLLVTSQGDVAKCVLNNYNCKNMLNASGQCESCYDGYYLDTARRCTFLTTISNCAEYDDNRNCKKCVGDLQLTDDGQCRACQAGYIGKNCDQCISGYVMEDGICKPCLVQNCIKCTAGSRSTCDTCAERFTRTTLGEATYTTQVCETCEFGCLECDSRKECTKCEDTLFLHSGVCYKQQSYCAEWDAKNNQCQVCEYGYRLNFIGQDRFCLKCFAYESGVIHCPTSEDTYNAANHYSTVNDDNLEGQASESTESTEEEEDA